MNPASLTLVEGEYLLQIRPCNANTSCHLTHECATVPGSARDSSLIGSAICGQTVSLRPNVRQISQWVLTKASSTALCSTAACVGLSTGHHLSENSVSQSDVVFGVTYGTVLLRPCSKCGSVACLCCSAVQAGSGIGGIANRLIVGEREHRGSRLYLFRPRWQTGSFCFEVPAVAQLVALASE